MVVVFHVFQVEPVPTQSLPRLLYMLTRLGQTGVDLFFVLSGFLITGILFDAKRSSRYFVNFYGRRTVRIFPLYYGVLVVFLVILPHLFGVRLPSVAPAWLWTYTANLPMSFEADGGMLGHFWTLAIEEQFYLIWPSVVFLAGRTALMRICLSCMALAVVARIFAESWGISSFYFTLCRMDSLTLGGFLALAIRKPDGVGAVGYKKTAIIAVLATLLVMAPCYALKSGGGDAWVQVIKYSFTAAFYGAVLMLVVGAPVGSRIERLLTLRPLRGIGRISYGLYVFHPLAIVLIERTLTSSRAGELGVPASAMLWLRFASIVALSLAASLASWHLLERPFLTLKRYFEDRPEPERSEFAATDPRPSASITLGAPLRG
jgi:peptidoglycan/LPS O-acetylase OafA/YrhL